MVGKSFKFPFDWLPLTNSLDQLNRHKCYFKFNVSGEILVKALTNFKSIAEL